MRRLLLVLSLLVLPCLSQAQWEQLPGPCGGSVNAFVEIAGSHGGRIYASTLNGVYVTTNQGRFWNQAGLNGMHVFNLIQTQTDSVHEVLLAVVGPKTELYNGNTLFRSTDSGRSWIDLHFSGGYVLSMFQSGSLIFLLSSVPASLKRSTDQGATWEDLPPLWHSISAAIAIQENLLAMIGDTAYRMPDTGHVWQKLGRTPLWGPCLLQSSGKHLYCISNLDADWGLYESGDLGLTWSRLSQLPYGGGSSLAIHDSIFLLAGTWRSSDGGKSWLKINGLGGFPAVNAGINPAPMGLAYIDTEFFAGSSAGPLASKDGINWEYRSDGIPAAQIHDLAYNGNILFAATDRGVFESSDHGDSWIAPVDSLGLRDSLVQQFFVVDSMVYAYNSWNAPARSLWRWDTTHWTKLLDSAVNSLTALGNVLFVATFQGGIMESTNAGKTWAFANSGLPTLGFIEPVRANAVFRCGTRLIAAVDTGMDMVDSIYTALYFSDDSGQHWALIPGSAPYSELFSEVTLDSTIFIALGQVSRSTDCGNNWSVLTDLPNTEYLSQIGQNIFLTSTYPSSSAISLFVTGSGSVKSLGSPDSTTSVQCLTSDDQYVYAGTYRQGLWRMPLSELPLAVPETPIEISKNFLKIYPNPLSTKSWVAFSLPSRSRVSLRLYDELGILRADLFEGEMGEGQHEIPFAGQGLADGIYSVVLSADGNRQVGRVLIVR